MNGAGGPEVARPAKLDRTRSRRGGPRRPEPRYPAMNSVLASGLLVRLAVVVTNLWLAGSLSRILDYDGSIGGRLDLAAFAILVAVIVMGATLAMQSVLEHAADRRAIR